MVQQNITPDHESVFKSDDGYEMRDLLDEQESTVQYIVRSPKTNKIISAIEIIGLFNFSSYL